MTERLRQHSGAVIPIILLVLAFIFYGLTVAPTVLWGDDAEYQSTAFDGILRKDAGGHWLWLQAARLFVRLPWGNVAYRVNLLSAVAAAITIALVYVAARAAGIAPWGALAASASLAVAHTFWMHAVRAEVYTVFTVVLTLQLCLWFAWRPRRLWPIMLAALLFGLTILGHQMAVLLLPALAFLLWRRHTWLTLQQWLVVALLFGLGLIPFVAVVWWQGDGSFLNGVRAHFTRFGADFAPAMFNFSLSLLPGDLTRFILYMGLQFAGVAGLFGLWGVIVTLRSAKHAGWALVRDPEGRDESAVDVTPALTVLVFYVTAVLWAFSYRVNDQFVFYIPAYVAFCFFAGWGWQALVNGRRLESQRAKIGLLTVLVIVPVALYAILPALLTSMHMNPLAVRSLPGREPNSFFLWPGKRDYTGASDYGRAVLASLPRQSILLADATPLGPLLYLQKVEKIRPDVRLIQVEPGEDLGRRIKSLPAGRSVFLGDDNPKYYDLSSLPGRIEPFGVIYQFRPAAAN